MCFLGPCDFLIFFLVFFLDLPAFEQGSSGHKGGGREQRTKNQEIKNQELKAKNRKRQSTCLLAVSKLLFYFLLYLLKINLKLLFIIILNNTNFI